MIFGLGVGCLVVIGAVVHAFTMLRKTGILKPIDVVFSDHEQSRKSQEEAAASETYKLWDLTRHIYLFNEEPSVADLINVRNEAPADKDTVFVVERNTVVSIVNDPGKAAVKVRVFSGKQSGRVGWVCRSLLIKENAA